MIEPRPDKWRGATATVDLAASAVFGAAVYQPPASGARVTLVGCNVLHHVGVLNAAALTALTFTPGASVTTTTITPTWGSDYAPTGVFSGGTFLISALGTLLARSANTTLESFVWYVFPPNVFVVGPQVIAAASLVSIVFDEYPSAEELNRWRSAPA